MILRSRKLLALIGIVAMLAGGAAGTALAAGGDTSAVAVNTKDNSFVFKLAFQIKRVTSDLVDNQNAAVAYADCQSCETVAISIQVLLIAANATDFEPGNYAIAINQNCQDCDTLATAYQFAIGVDSKLKFTHDGKKEIADIRHQLEQLRNSGLSGPEIQSRVGDLMGQLNNVLSTQLIGIGDPAATPEPAPAPAATPAPQGTTPDTTTTQTTPSPSPSTDTTTTPDQGSGTTDTTTTPTQTGTTDTTGTDTTSTPTDTTNTSTTP